MIRKFISLSCFLIGLFSIQAQTPSNISIEGETGVTLRAPEDCNEAGTIRYGLHKGQSNDVSSETIYLCFGDSMQLIHNQDFILDGDPNPGTPAGIGYAFYDCPPTPTFSGSDLATIVRDPCLNKTSPIFLNGVPVPQTDGLWIAAGEANGNIMLANRGQLQEAFAGGEPVQFWFAPITIDDFAGLTYESDGAGGPAGPCVDVSPEAAFSVVYLNPLTIEDLRIDAGPNGCVGSFVIDGGLPEFEDRSDYQITIVKEDDPGITGQVVMNPLPEPGEAVAFFVPEPGQYRITVEDDKSCAVSTSADMSGCEAVTFELPFINARPGASICLDVTVENFQDVALFQGTITWDSDVLNFTGIEGLNSNLINLQDAFETPAEDTLTFAWFEPGFAGINLPDGAVIFQVCFEVAGVLGQSSPVAFVDTPTPVEVGDSNDQEKGHITRSGQVNVSEEVLFVDISTDSVECSDEANGAIQIRVAQGQPNYRVSWDSLPSPGPFKGPIVITDDGGATRLENLPAGSYEIRIEDSASPPNTYIDTVEIFQPLALGASIDGQQPTCFGESTGSVSVEVFVGGIIQTDLSGYSFAWNRSNQNVSRLDSVGSGLYQVTVTAPNGCTAEASTTLSQPAPITLDEVITDASCSGATNGGLMVTAGGGNPFTGNYTFEWDSLGTFVTNVSTVTNLSAGEYFLTVTDDNGCFSADSFVVSADKMLSINEVITDISCNAETDGEVIVSGSTTGAAADLPYTFVWEGPGIPAGSSDTGDNSTRSNLAAGMYSVTMSDADPAGCQVVENYTLTEPDPIAITLEAKTDETCVVGMDGNALIEVSGGTLPYEYVWFNEDRDTVSTDTLATDLSAGRYAAQITDANGCIDSLEVFINAPTPPLIQPIENDTLLCFNDTNGTLTVNATPGNAPITGYQWSNNIAGQTITGLSPGVYYVSVSAEDGCVNVDSALVVAPSPLQLDSIVDTAPTCAGDSDGSLTVFASGGTAPYTYIWNDQPTNDTLSFNLYPGLSAGDYQVSVVDGNNCETVTGSGTVTDPPGIQVTFTDTVAVSCFDDVCDGQATANALYSDGSTGLFTFSWETGESASGVSSAFASQLCAGLQTITVTDADQCFSVDTIDVPSPAAITIQADIEPISCNGLSDGAVTLEVSGGTPAYDLLWVESGASGNSLSDLPAGAYSAVITDANGCNKSQLIEIREPAALELSIDDAQTRDPSCNGSDDGVLAVQFNQDDSINPIGPEPFTWSNGIAPASAPVADGLTAGVYAVTLTDVKGCQDSLTYTLNEPSPIVALIPDPADPRCFGESTIIIIDTIFGGNGSDLFDYTYQIDNNGLDFTPDQPAVVFAGQHVITIEDPLGCTYQDTVDINQPEELTVAFDPEVVEIELGDSTTRLDPIITNSLPIDSFIWTPTMGLSSYNVQRPIVKEFEDQRYTLTVVDENGCQGTGSVFVEIDRNRNVYIPNVFSPNGDGPNDEFRVFACQGVEEITSARIFDRWGNLVYESTDLLHNCDGGTAIWDGRLNAQFMQSGVFVYMIEIKFIDNVSRTYRGDVTLLR